MFVSHLKRQVDGPTPSSKPAFILSVSVSLCFCHLLFLCFFIHSCNTSVARWTNSWFTAINRSDLSGDFFWDLEKPFSLVDHRILLSKFSV